MADRLDLPERIGPGDLVVAAGTGDAGQAPDEGLNVLAASLENWAEAAYQHLGQRDRERLDSLLRRLAVKDPNTGMYSQQRINVDEGARLLGPGKTHEDLKALLSDGFIGNLDYLYWDDDDPQRITLKVSLESFTLHIGKGERDGWLAARATTARGDLRLRAGPWSTCALARLGAQVLPPQSDGERAGKAGRKDPCGIAEVSRTKLVNSGAS